MSPAECVVEIVDDAWLTVKLLEGEIELGAVLTCVESGQRYRVENFGLGGWRTNMAGYRVICVQSLTDVPASPLRIGDKLIVS